MPPEETLTLLLTLWYYGPVIALAWQQALFIHLLLVMTKGECRKQIFSLLQVLIHFSYNNFVFCWKSCGFMVVEDQTFAFMSVIYSHAHTTKHQRLVLQWNLVQSVQHYSLNIKKKNHMECNKALSSIMDGLHFMINFFLLFYSGINQSLPKIVDFVSEIGIECILLFCSILLFHFSQGENRIERKIN